MDGKFNHKLHPEMLVRIGFRTRVRLSSPPPKIKEHAKACFFVFGKMKEESNLSQAFMQVNADRRSFLQKSVADSRRRVRAKFA